MTNNRKRKPGGGCKPRGPVANKQENFSTRISAETRREIELVAKAKGWSISQAAEYLLKLGAQEEREQFTINETKALRFLVGQLADECSLAIEGKTYEWFADRFAFEAFEHALSLLCDKLRPINNELRAVAASGKYKAYSEVLKSPKALGETQFLGLLWEMDTFEPKNASAYLHEYGLASREAGTLERYRRALASTKKTLKLGGKP